MTPLRTHSNKSRQVTSLLHTQTLNACNQQFIRHARQLCRRSCRDSRRYWHLLRNWQSVSTHIYYDELCLEFSSWYHAAATS